MMGLSTDPDTNSERIWFNGVDFLTGTYLTPPLLLKDLVQNVQEEFDQMSQGNRELITNLSAIKSASHYGFNANLEDVEEARWGIIFALDETDAVCKALQPLIERRSKQIGSDAPVFTYRPGWTAGQFLAHHDVQRGFGDVEKVPYYLLLVGGPEKVPFRFQYELAGEYAVGRLAFDDASGYQAYIEQLIDYETSQDVHSSRQAAFWAPANRNSDDTEWDHATSLSSSILVQGLFDAISPNLQVEKLLARGPEATKERLAALLSKPNPPALLFTASHGLGFSSSTPDQPKLQGALVAQDWKIDQPATAEVVFAGQDFHMLPGANVRGMVHFAFACFGAGTPQMDEYQYGKLSLNAERPFVAKLPTQLLQSGMLGFIGHIDRAWGFSFIDQNHKPMLEGYKRAVNRILKGKPLGHALRDQYDRGVQLSASLVEDLNEMGFGKIIPPASLASRWMERNDARSYCLLGDPAAQVRIAE